jgi:hypothetical protein
MSVPNTFASATTPIPLSNLDANFAYYDAAYSIAAGTMTVSYNLAVTGVVSGVGFSNYLASPPAIGGTAPAAGTFSALTARTSLVVPAPAVATISAAATLTNANIQAQIINTTGLTYAITMPLGTTLETLVTWGAVNLGYDFSIVNTATGTITLAANTGVTTLGSLTVLTATSARFRIQRTAANTFVLYRLS